MASTEMQLSERQEQILKTIVDQYVLGAHPIGSAAIVAASGLAISSATVRSEMAVLEDAGFVRHLHTSGGRVPTNDGYRYYVERLMAPLSLSTSEARTIRHQFHQAPTEVHEWLKLAATVMAHRGRNVGLVTAPRSAEVRLRHLEAIAIQGSVALIIVVLADGTVIQEMAPLADPHTQDELSPLADRLSQTFRDLPASQIEARLLGLTPLENSIASVAVHLLRRGEEQHSQVFHAGLADLIRQPEFTDARPGDSPATRSERLRHMVEFLNQGFAIQQLVNRLPPYARFQVVIGGDTPSSNMEDYSFVIGRYGDEADSSGYLGIVGPTRMQYPRAIALVRYMTDLMTDLMQAY
ncbi:MAG: heat-inducible transcriptional repressor HrcA [Chloroflexota bacterium]